MSFTVLIPARFASTRLPGKPLADIGGKPMVVRVAERALASGAAQRRRGHRRRARAGGGRRARVRRVHDPRRSPHRHRPARRGGAQLGLPDDAIVVNVQGDEPLLAPALIRAMADLLAAKPDAAIATACHAIDDPAEAFNPNVVKVVADRDGYAMYFSRATIPWARDAFAARVPGAPPPALPPGLPLFRHYGLYAYRVAFLRAIRRWRRRRSRASRRWSSCGRSGTATGSRWRSPKARPLPASTRPGTSSASARSTRPARRDRSHRRAH